jgi:cobalt-zinc-cadmium efflux system protein
MSSHKGHGHSPGDGHGHKHGDHKHAHRPHHDFRNQNRTKLWIVLLLTLSFMGAEVVAGLYTGSLALLADAGHMFSDAAGIGLALIAVWFSGKPPSLSRSYGYYRTEILASMANASMLLVISLWVLYSAGVRLFDPTEVVSGPMIWVALAGLVINAFCAKVLHSSAEHNLNMKGAYLEVVSDMIASAGVLVAALIIKFTGWFWVDAVVSAAIGLMILPRTWQLLSESVNVLMEGTPSRIDLGQLKDELKSVAGVVDVHDLHVWTITSGLDSLSAHIRVDNSVSSTAVLEAIHELLEHKFSIQHSTVQLESVDCKRDCPCAPAKQCS